MLFHALIGLKLFFDDVVEAVLFYILVVVSSVVKVEVAKNCAIILIL